MSTRDCTPQRSERIDHRDGGERSASMQSTDRVALLKEGASINRYISPTAERYLPNVTIDQRLGSAYGRCDNGTEVNNRNFDPRNLQNQFDPRYGADRRSFDPRNGDPRFDPRNGGDPRLDPRNGGDPRFDPRNGGDPRLDPRNGGDPRLDPRNGRDPRLDSQSFAPDGQMRDHTVQRGDSLWKIARNALRESGQPASARDIMNAIRSIVEANKAEHPSLANNPNLIIDGWHLKIPVGGQDASRADGTRDLYQFGGDRRQQRTRYDGGDAYFDQRDGAYQRPYGEGPGEFRGRRHSRGDWSGREYGTDPYGRRIPYDRNGEPYPYERSPNPYGRNPYERNPYEQNPYRRGPYDSNPYARPPGYGQDAANQPMNPLSMALREAALLAARGMQTIGRCAAGVQVALARIGHGQFMGSGNAWDMGAKMARSGKFDVLPLSEAREGDVIVRSWNRNVIAQNRGRNWGDIVVVTSRDSRGNLMGANDHHGRIPPDGGRYTNSYVLRCRT
ncbi:MAG: LysM peptidoglycan-binding domain-containing protein [Candidatus Melainabacteria bacterium]|nr:MAG: LysM peptidoglycan-binding domain-containing protein [Candidatus Melainabacteria bacterium]